MRNWNAFFLAATTLFLFESRALSADKLVIISPHRKSIQQEFVPAFKKYYKSKHGTEVKVEWIDQGGTSDDVRFVRAKFKKNPKTSSIDVFWGGGSTTFMQLESDGLLAPYKISKELVAQIPSKAAGVPIYSKTGAWYASAMSSFGIFFNKKILMFEKLPEPKRWEDLADPKFNNYISLTDPRRSGTFSLMNEIIMQSQGWKKGWNLLTRIAGNTRTFAHSSSDPIKAVVSGDAAASIAIDFYAISKVAALGKKNLGFNLPEGQTIFDSDPVAILKGAPNKKTSERFVEFLLNKDVQKIWVLEKGKPGGPKLSFLGRMAVNKKTYEETENTRVSEFNPFLVKSSLEFDGDRAAKVKTVMNDLIGAILVDTHKELRHAWAAVSKKGDPKLIEKFGETPITQEEALSFAEKWDDEVFRNEKINQWVQFARKKFKAVEKASLSH